MTHRSRIRSHTVGRETEVFELGTAVRCTLGVGCARLVEIKRAVERVAERRRRETVVEILARGRCFAAFALKTLGVGRTRG